VEAFTRWLAAAERSPLTVRSYLADLRGFAQWFEQVNGQALAPSLVTPTDLREFKRHLVEERQLQPATVNRRLAALKAYLRWADEAELEPASPPSKVPRSIPEQRPGPRWLDRLERNALLRAVERGGKVRDLALVQVLLNTGLRVAELCDLRWSDVTLSERQGQLVVRAGKGEKRRTVPLNKDAREAFGALGYLEHQGTEARVFMGQRGALQPRGVQVLLGKYLTTAKLTRLTPHVLRHTFCKSLVDSGVGLEKVASLAGHDSLETTRRYVEPSLRDLAQAVELIAESD
jgi:integrase/recombinase XerC